MSLFKNKMVHNKYRVLPELELSSNDFPKDKDGQYLEENLDFYIPCNRFTDTKIFQYDGNQLSMFITNTGWKDIRSEYRADTKKTLAKLTTDVISNSKETEIRFNAKDLKVFAGLVKARTKGAKVDPYDEVNLRAQRKASRVNIV